MYYNKLVRDNIPKIIKDDNKIPVTRIASEEEFSIRLNDKLQEEVAEYLASESVEELADIAEVLRAIAHDKGFAPEYVEDIRQRKYKEHGGFHKRIILEETIEP